MTDHTETFTLSRPLKTHSGDISALTLKEPTAGAIIDYGDPFTLKPRYNAAGEQDGFTYEFHNKILVQFLVDMIAESVDDLLLKGISTSDFLQLRARAAHLIMAGEPDRNFSKPSAD